MSNRPRKIRNTQYAVTIDVLPNENDLMELTPETGVLIYWKNELFMGNGSKWLQVTGTIKTDLNDGTKF